jgi:uncharacterized membrane protein
MSDMSESTKPGISDNTAGAIAYITVFPAIAFLILVPYKRSAFVRFHAWQCIYLNFVALVLTYTLGFALAWCGVSGAFLFELCAWLIGIFWVLTWLFCTVSAMSGKRVKLPIIGALAERQANG